MRLFSSDLFRNFGIGFAAGAVLIAGANAEQWGGELASPAQASEPRPAATPAAAAAAAAAAEFVILPEAQR